MDSNPPPPPVDFLNSIVVLFLSFVYLHCLFVVVSFRFIFFFVFFHFSFFIFSFFFGIVVGAFPSIFSPYVMIVLFVDLVFANLPHLRQMICVICSHLMV